MRRVQVLMSTYNGSNYLAEQIESILAQKRVRVSLLIRDDGSTDTTPEILKQYAGENVRIYTGKNIGTQKSYFDLLKHADIENDYYAFSDQDDVWHPRKLQKAVEMLENKAARPLLYASRVIYASQDLSKKKKWKRPLLQKPSFGNALVENICMGCTQVFNYELLELVRGCQPDCAILHDWWLYMTAAYFGTVIFDENAYMLYRQHAKNQVGMQDTWFLRQKARLHRVRRLKGLVSAQARDFADVYRERIKEREVQVKDAAAVDEDVKKEKELLELIVGYRKDWRKKWEIVTKGAIYRQDRMDQIIYRVLFGIGYL